MSGFEELKNKFTMSYGMAFAIIGALFLGFGYWHEHQANIELVKTLQERGEKRYKRHLEVQKDHEGRLRTLELNHSTDAEK